MDPPTISEDQEWSLLALGRFGEHTRCTFVSRAGGSAISIDAKSKTQAGVKLARQQTRCLVSPSSFMPPPF